MKSIKKMNRLMPDLNPKYIRCYDNGGRSFDRYTVVYTGRYKKTGRFWFDYVSMSANPYSPLGFGQHGQSEFQPVDRPKYSHLGRKIKFNDLTADCRDLVINDYMELWNLK